MDFKRIKNKRLFEQLLSSPTSTIDQSLSNGPSLYSDEINRITRKLLSTTDNTHKSPQLKKSELVCHAKNATGKRITSKPRPARDLLSPLIKNNSP